MTINTAPNRRILPTTLAAALAGLLLLSGCTKQTDEDGVAAETQTTQTETTNAGSAAEQAGIDRLLVSYADMAHAAYKDSLETAKDLQNAVNTYVDTPTEANLEAQKRHIKQRVSRIRRLKSSALMRVLSALMMSVK